MLLIDFFLNINSVLLPLSSQTGDKTSDETLTGTAPA